MKMLSSHGLLLLSVLSFSQPAMQPPLGAAQVDLPKASASKSSSLSAIPVGDMPALVRLHHADRVSIGEFYNMAWAPVRFERLAQLHREWEGRLQTVDFDKLDQQGRIDYLLLRTRVRSDLARLTLDRQRLDEMEPLMPFRVTIQGFEQARWRMEPVNPQKAASVISTIPEQVKKLRKRIEKGKKEKAAKNRAGETASSRGEPAEISASEHKLESAEKENVKPEAEPPLNVSASLARRTASAVSDLRSTLKTWAAFYDGFVPEFSWWMKKPNDEALSAIEEYAKFLREEIAGLKGKEEDPLVGDPIGAEALAKDIESEMLAYSAEELIAIGEAEFTWCETQMKQAAKEMGFAEDWKAALAKVKSDFVPPGKQDSVILEEARQAIQFIKNHALVTVPPLAEEIWRLTMMQPDAQKTMPYAAYNGPNMMVAYAKDDMKHEDKLMSMRGNNRHFMHIVTPHELIPGHHLQRFMAARNRTHRELFSTPFFVEGWALYWELMLWDLGYGQTPEDRVGMLFWRMHRAARIIVSLKFHLGQMKPAEMVDFLVDRVGHERLGATSEVRRFIGSGYSPLYQCGYMIGGLQLKALRQELVGGGRMTDRQFNDAVLTYGPISVELIRAGMLAVPLDRDFEARWKFAGENPRGKTEAK